MSISISYDMVLDIENRIATSVCEQFEFDGAVSPTCLRKGLFTIGAMDNLDHNPTSATSQSSFHGTRISLFQCPTRDTPGEVRPPIFFPPFGARNHKLPDSYAIVPAVALKAADVAVPRLSHNTEVRQCCFRRGID